MLLRTWHAYLAQFIAPMMIFFGLTGALQVFGLHESSDGYAAPVLLQKLGRLHKDQVFAMPPERRHPAPSPAAGAAPEPADDDRTSVGTAALKVLSCLAAVLFCSSGVLGIVIGLRRGRRRRVSAILLASGAAVPLLCLALAAAAP